MPTPQDSLWLATKERRYADIKPIIEANASSDLINAQHPENERTFPIQLIQSTINKKELKPRELIVYVLKHPKMNWNFQHPKIKQTPASSILDAVEADADFEIIKSMKNVRGFVMNTDKLTYELASERLKKAENFLQLRIEKRKSHAEIDEAQLNVNRWKEIVSLIRDISILFAIEADDATLFERLDKAKADPTGLLGSFGKGELPIYLLKPRNVNIEAWYKAKSAERASNRNAFFAASEARLNDHQELVAQAKAIHTTYADKDADIRRQALAARAERMQTAISTMPGSGPK